jgi:glycosyltransferase involved in cell wall biosynthesis
MRMALLAAHYQPAQVPCGVGDYTRCLRAALEQLGHDCLVVTSVRSHSQEPHVHPIADRWGLVDCLKVWRLLRKMRPDALIVQYTPEQYGFGIAFKLLPLLVRWTQRQTAVITTFHTLVGGRWIAKPNALLMAAASHGLISVHAELSELFQRHLSWWSSKLHEIPIGANIPSPSLGREAARQQLCRRLGLDGRGALVGTFGFAGPGKGWDTLFHALQHLDTTPPTHLLCIGAVREGDRAHRSDLDRLAHRLGIAERIHWLTDIPSQDVADCLAGLDVYAVPYDDGASLRRGTLMAGFQVGVPTVTTTPRYAHPALRHGDTILVVAPQSSKALAQCVRELLADVDLQRRLREGMRVVAGQFQWSTIAAQHVHVRQTLMEQERQAA